MNPTIEIIESANDVYVEVGECSILTIGDQDVLDIFDEVGTPGAPGPAGVTGPVGPQGPPGTGGVNSVTFGFVTPATSWTITHNLGTKAIQVGLFESDGITDKEGEVIYPDNNTIEVIWYYPESGLARLYF